MTIEIEALDTLFFRDGKPFSMGDDTWANGMFPPLPSVLYGALRTAYMAQQNIAIDDIIEKTKELRIKQIFYKVKSTVRGERTKTWETYFPMPLDLVMESDLDKQGKINRDKYKNYDAKLLTQTQKLEHQPINVISGSLNKNNLTYSTDAEVEGFEDGIFRDTLFKNYLKNKISNGVEIRKISNYTKVEAKIGISRQNETRTTEEGKLYRVNMLRPDNLTICIEFEGLDNFEDKGLLRLGAENKLATYKKNEDTEISPINFEGIQDFKIYLATPAIFKQGYYPTEIFKKAKVEATLLTCAVGKYINVGGFDMQKREPKPMQKAVPAGTVYYYQLEKGSLQDLAKELQKNGISEYNQNEGFGIAYIGKL